MKNAIKFFTAMLMIGFCFLTVKGYAQAPTMNVTLDNEKVKVTAVEFKPGDMTPTHSHPDHILYVLSGGKLEIVEQGQPAKIVVFKDGSTIWNGPVTHTVKNVGDTTIKLILIELKTPGPNK